MVLSTINFRTTPGNVPQVQAIPPNYLLSPFLGTPIVATTNRIATAADFVNSTLAIAAQPDVPRNLTATLTDVNASVTAGLLTITGLDPYGNTVTETPTFTQLVAGWTGTKVFASVSSLVITGSVGAQTGTDQVVIGVGNVIGIFNPIVNTSAVKHVYLGGVRIASPVVTAGTQTSGVDASSGTYNGSKLLLVIYNPLQ